MYELIRSLIDTVEMLGVEIHVEQRGELVQHWYELGKHQWLVSYEFGADEPESVQLVGTTHAAFLEEYADEESRISYAILTEDR